MTKKFLLSLIVSILFLPAITLASTIEPKLISAPSVMPINQEIVPISENIMTKTALYNNPQTKEFYQINNASQAFKIIKEQALGVSQKNYEKFAKKAPSNLDGRIILNVEDHGKAYIVDYKNDKLIYLGKLDRALRIFSEFRLESITAKTWTWLKTLTNDGVITYPKVSDDFSITFTDENSFNGTTDCNSYFGQYIKDDNNLNFDKMGSTKMYCHDSQEQEYISSLSEVDKYMFNEQGNLVLLLKYDSGSIIFE